MASNRIQTQGTPTKSPQHIHQQQSGFEQLDKSTSNTLKRNPKMELNRADLLKLMSYLEGELQAREIVIATLKSEKVKQLLNLGGYRPASINDPLAALQRDSFAANEPRVDEMQIRAIADHQMSSLDNLILQHRKTQLRMTRVLKEAEERHKKVVQELDEEKRKHEHDTAQGDDITYGLEKERTRLKQELEAERQAKKKLEKDYKKVLELMEEERERKKHIVLLLLAERKKIITKYIEESKRSEDLAQILTEEKGRVDTMAEGLEEESKKSLHFEAELEKHLAQCDTEQQKLKAALSKEEKRVKELESELDKTKEEVESLKKQLLEAHQFIMLEAGQQRGTIQRPSSSSGTPPPPPAKPNLLACHTSPRATQPSTPAKGSAWAQSGIPHMDGSVSPPPTGTPMMSSVAKVVQPTATVSSVPVCGPTTGIARSVSPGQGIRNVAYSVASSPDSRTAAISRDPSSWPQQQTTQESQPVPVPPEKPVTTRIVPNADRSQPQVHQVTSRVCVSAPPRTKVIKSSQGGTLTVLVTQNSESGGVGTPIPPNIPQGTTTASVTSPVPVIPSPVSAPSPQGVAVTPPKKVAPLGRGAPPPVPPNKPVVPPKKEAFPRAITPLAASAASVASIPDSSQSSNMVDAKKPVPSGGLKFGKGIPKDKNRVTDRSPQQGVEAGGGGGGDGSSHHHPDAGGGGRAGRREPQVGECGCNRDICHCGTCPAPSLDETQPATARLVPPNPATHSCSQTADAAPLNGGVLAHSEVARPALHEAPDLDMLGQELADFQDLLSSMVSGADVAANKPTSAQAANSVDSTLHCVPANFNGSFRENNIVTLASQSDQDVLSTKTD